MKKTFDDKDKLAEELAKIITQQPYLAQQPLELIQYEEKPVDFRVHLFKNKRGGWDVLSNSARIGPLSGIVTGQLWGGCRKPAEVIFKHVFTDQDSKELLQKIEDAALKIASAIDQLHRTKFGELGFDFAVDKEQKIWMIEVNPKPNWNIEGADAGKLEKIMAQHLLGYCRYLLGLHKFALFIGCPAQQALST